MLNAARPKVDIPTPRAEPVTLDPTPSDPTPSDPTPSDPTPSDPTRAEPIPAEPAPVDQGSSNLGPSEYADRMPLLRRYAGLPDDHPERDGIRSELVLAFLPVVEHLARRHGNGYRVASYDDLVQTGTVGLITAIDRWDPERAKGEFLGYLIPCVRGEILRYFRDRTWSMRVPRRLKDLGVSIAKATGPLTQKLGRAPRPSELAAHLDVDREEIIDALAATADRHSAPLYPVDDDGSGEERIGSVERAYERVEYELALRPLIDELPERERRILRLRFFEDQSQSRIAEQVGVSQMHVSRLLARTLATLREGLTADTPPPGREAAVARGR
ncbi:sigma-70 family RNA polymerase sigma factor [Pseudonocardia sp. N23]|uniref:sigma-70 family RNA polymerase sigma factor n=1 Tax=Pseudonocardia sp. N23 TaxID=1987376 RepID=UPI000C02F8FA|nr:sigma-70 family RNA polymerase sigma factor [Pseudonocardia sp. N23]GAY08032.1 RNA polymerase sigma factor SigB [Pseudonocardia sp. N23]